MASTILKGLGVVIAFLGFIMIAGSANDCDGACMESANDIPTMIMVIGYGFMSIIGGIALYMSGKYFE